MSQTLTVKPNKAARIHAGCFFYIKFERRKIMAKVTTTTTVYKSRQMTDYQKRIWVRKYLKFKEAFPHVPMADWCKMNNLAFATFSHWCSDVRYNKDLYSKAKFSPAEEEGELDFGDPEPEPEKQTGPEQPQDSQDIQVKTETTFPSSLEESDASETNGKFVIFTCADFRLEISRAMPASDIDRMIGFATAQAFKYRKSSQDWR